jgi:hypothetical protein
LSEGGILDDGAAAPRSIFGTGVSSGRPSTSRMRACASSHAVVRWEYESRAVETPYQGVQGLLLRTSLLCCLLVFYELPVYLVEVAKVRWPLVGVLFVEVMRRVLFVLLLFAALEELFYTRKFFRSSKVSSKGRIGAFWREEG